MPPDDGPQALENGFVLLERERDLVGGAPGVGIETLGRGFQLGPVGLVERLLVKPRDDVEVTRAQADDAVGAQPRLGWFLVLRFSVLAFGFSVLAFGFSVRGFSVRGFSVRGFSVRGFSVRGFGFSVPEFGFAVLAFAVRRRL